MSEADFDIVAAIKGMGDTKAEQAFATISIANRMVRMLPAPQPDPNLAPLYEWLTDRETRESEKVAPLPDELAFQLSDTLLRLAAHERRLLPTLTTAVAEQQVDDRAAVRETLSRAAAVSFILLVAKTAFDAHGANWDLHVGAVSDDALRALIAQLATLAGLVVK